MNRKLIPRLTTEQAMKRLRSIEHALREGQSAVDLVQPDLAEATFSDRGGEEPRIEDLQRWRVNVAQAMNSLPCQSKAERDAHSARLGQAIVEFIDPSPSDAANDGAWSFLSLSLFPDIVYARWPPDATTHELAADRWVGRQVGRDRNYLKLAWRRWRVLGPVMRDAAVPLGEDEFGALLERSALARNVPLVQAAAREIVSFSNVGARTEFARRLMVEVTYLTGPLNLDVMSPEELVGLVAECATRAAGATQPAADWSRTSKDVDGDWARGLAEESGETPVTERGLTGRRYAL